MTKAKDNHPPPSGSSDKDFLGQVRGASQEASANPSEQSTESISDAFSRRPGRIGHYHIKRVMIASGGAVTRYEAMQERPRSAVALKLMRNGIASRSSRRRFEYESQILARLRHTQCLCLVASFVKQQEEVQK